MSILDKAIDACGGVSSLARHLSIEPTAIHQWRRRGIPDSWERVLLLMQRHGDGVFGAHVTNVSVPGRSIGAVAHKE